LKPRPRVLRWVRPPRQDRSRRTLDRILDATEALLADRTFDQLTIGEVVRRARSSVGAFYTRFPNKKALLAALFDRHQQEAMATVESMLDPARWQGADVREIVKHIVHFTVRLYRRKRGLLRALVLQGHAHPDRRYQDPKQRDHMAVARVGALLATRRAEIQHPDPKLAGALGFLFVLATAREKILFGESTASAVRVDDQQLECELIRAFLAYLGVKNTAPGDRKNE